MADLDAAPGRKQRGNQQGVLLGDGAAELGDDPRGHPELEADGVDVTAARPAACEQEHLVLLLVCGDFLYDCRQGLLAEVTDGLPADLQDVHVRKEPLLRGHVVLLGEGLTDETLPHELALDVQSFPVALPDQRHGASIGLSGFTCRG